MNAIRITIPTPCHESWGNMSPVSDITSYCAACEKTLVDFSAMSDTEIALWFTQNKGKVCGRFSASQVNRKLDVPSEKPVRAGRRFWLNALWLLPAAWFAKPAAAQEVIRSKPPVSVKTGENKQEISQEVGKLTAIKGRVTDGDTKKGIAGATVYIRRGEQTLATVKTDSKGNYSWKTPDNFKTENVSIEVRIHRYEPSRQTLDATKTNFDFTLYEERYMLMGDVYVEPDKKD